jgi:hypothetical protein
MVQTYFLASIIIAPVLFPFVLTLLRNRIRVQDPFLAIFAILTGCLALEGFDIVPFLFSLGVWGLLAFLVWRIVAFVLRRRAARDLMTRKLS